MKMGSRAGPRSEGKYEVAGAGGDLESGTGTKE